MKYLQDGVHKNYLNWLIFHLGIKKQKMRSYRRQTLYQKTQQTDNHAPTAKSAAEYWPKVNMPEILWLANSAAKVTQPKSAENKRQMVVALMCNSLI